MLARQAGDQVRPAPPDAVAAVWGASKAIADQLGFPQDTEWAWRDGQLFILQSRPITTIADVFYSRQIEPWRADPRADPDAPERVWSRMLADETWVSPISPLFYNIHNSTPGRVGFIRAHGDQGWIAPDLFKYHRAIAYCDIGLIERMYGFQPPIARIRGVLNFCRWPPSVAGRRRSSAVPLAWPDAAATSSYEFKGSGDSPRSSRTIASSRASGRPASNEQPTGWFDTDLDALGLAGPARAPRRGARGHGAGRAALRHSGDVARHRPAPAVDWPSGPLVRASGS